jgi:uncharacterized protein YggE
MRYLPLLIVAALAAAPQTAAAQAAAGTPPTPPLLTISGQALVQKSPDLARVALSIVTNDDAAGVSAGKNATIYAALKAKLAALGIGSDALHTAAFGVSFVPYPPKGLPPEQRLPRYGYVTSRSLSVDVTPVEDAGKIVDAATAAGVTDVGGVSYDLRDRHAAYREALAAATADARRNAETLATAGGFSLVRVQSASAEEEPIPRFAPSDAMRSLAAAAPPPTDLGQAGPIAISATVTLSYLIR